MSTSAATVDIDEQTELPQLAGEDSAATEGAPAEDPAAEDTTSSQLRDAIRIVKGNPSDEDIAALVTVLTAAASAATPAGDKRPPELWGTPTTMHRVRAPYSPYSFAASRRY